MNVDEIKKAIEKERASILSDIRMRKNRIASEYQAIKTERAKLDALPRLAVKRTRKAKTNG